MASLLEVANEFVAECDAPHKFKGPVVDPLLSQAATVLEPALAKLFPKLDTTEVQGVVHWALLLGIKLQSGYTP